MAEQNLEQPLTAEELGFDATDSVPPVDVNEHPVDAPDDDGYNWARVTYEVDDLLGHDNETLADQIYLLIRAQKKLTAEYEERKRAITQQRETFEKAMRLKMERKKSQKQSFTFVNDDGVPVSITFAPDIEIHYKVDDWEALYQWIMDNNALDALQKRVSEKNMKEYLERLTRMVNDGECTPEDAIVPGLSQNSFNVLKVTTREVKEKKQ